MSLDGINTALKDGGFSYIAFAAYFLISAVLFHFTDIGRSLRMIGTNATCSEQTGIQPSKYLMIAFVIAGVGCGIGALLGQRRYLCQNAKAMVMPGATVARPIAPSARAP